MSSKHLGLMQTAVWSKILNWTEISTTAV